MLLRNSKEENFFLKVSPPGKIGNFKMVYLNNVSLGNTKVRLSPSKKMFLFASIKPL